MTEFSQAEFAATPLPAVPRFWRQSTINQQPPHALIQSVPRGLVSPALIAHVLVSKYTDHLPLDPQSEILACDGLDLGWSKLADRVGGADELREPDD